MPDTYDLQIKQLTFSGTNAAPGCSKYTETGIKKEYPAAALDEAPEQLFYNRI
jgi:hypothetical protein